MREGFPSCAVNMNYEVMRERGRERELFAGKSEYRVFQVKTKRVLENWINK